MDKNGNKKPSYNIRFGVMAIPTIVFAIVIIIGIVNNDAFLCIFMKFHPIRLGP